MFNMTCHLFVGFTVSIKHTCQYRWIYVPSVYHIYINSITAYSYIYLNGRINNFLKSWPLCGLHKADIIRRIAFFYNFTNELKCVLQRLPYTSTQHVRHGYKKV